MRNLVAIPSSILNIQLLVIHPSNFYILIRNNGQLVGFIVTEGHTDHKLELTTANPTPRQILQKQMFWVDNITDTGHFHEMLEGIGPILNQTPLIEKSVLY
jgi:hypothetical protein